MSNPSELPSLQIPEGSTTVNVSVIDRYAWGPAGYLAAESQEVPIAYC